MTFRVRLRDGDDVRALWILVLCVLLGGSLYVQARYRSALSATNQHIEMLYRRTAAESRTLHESASLIALERRADADLAHVSHDTSFSASTATLIATVFASARSCHTRVLELTPGAAQAEAAAPLDAAALTIRISGRFRDILSFVEDLSRHATLISVADTELAVANGNTGAAQAGPRLDATIHATLYRLHLPERKEMRVASGR